jgi:hypothetical protein
LELCLAPPNAPSPGPASPPVSPTVAARAVTPAASLHSPSPVPQDREQAAQHERNRLSTGPPAIKLSSVPWPANPPFGSLSIPGISPDDYPPLPIGPERKQVRSRAAEQDLNRSPSHRKAATPAGSSWLPRSLLLSRSRQST